MKSSKHVQIVLLQIGHWLALEKLQHRPRTDAAVCMSDILEIMCWSIDHVLSTLCCSVGYTGRRCETQESETLPLAVK